MLPLARHALHSSVSPHPEGEVEAGSPSVSLFLRWELIALGFQPLLPGFNLRLALLMFITCNFPVSSSIYPTSVLKLQF
jgi:hypothetical protein